jgi:hypothetical protein
MQMPYYRKGLQCAAISELAMDMRLLQLVRMKAT